MNINNLQFDYNSPVILTYFIVSLIVLILGYLTKDKINKLLFCSYRSSLLNPLTYIRMFTHSIGHSGWDHFVNNFLYILLIGPMIEEKYGSINLLIMFLITSLVIALFNILISNYEIRGASGNVFMLIVLSSFSNFQEGKIPITLILICLFYVITEVKKSIFEKKSKTYYAGHILGAVCGIIFGFLMLYHPEIFEVIKAQI